MSFVTILDESAWGERWGTRNIEVLAEKATLRDLIERRIRADVDEFNREQLDVFSGLINRQILNAS